MKNSYCDVTTPFLVSKRASRFQPSQGELPSNSECRMKNASDP